MPMCNLIYRRPSLRRQAPHAAIAVRRRALVSIFAALLFAGWGPLARADDLYIACAAGVTLSMAEVRDVFLGEKQFAGPVKLRPVDNSVVQADFLARVLKMDGTRYTTTWTKKSFRDGATPPSTKSGDAEVIEYLRHTPGGCGYLGSAPPPELTLIGQL
jgi:hypothetical protein